MIAILLETSGRSGWVSLIDESRCLGVTRLDQGRRHARDLAPAVGKLLADQGLKPAQVDAIAVSQGPGSYTGLRVGIASALAFRFATGCHLLTVPTFDILAHAWDEVIPDSQQSTTLNSGTKLEIIDDALKGWVYHQGFSRGSDRLWRSTRPLAVQTLAEWEKVKDHEAQVAVAGESPGAVAGEGGEMNPCGHLGRPIAASPEAFARIVRERAGRGQWDDSDIAEPLYLRPSSAELQMTQRLQETGK